MKDAIQNLLAQIREAEINPRKENVLPQNAYYLNTEEILCREREVGVSRFPYDADGLVLWAHSNGIIEACESTFHIFKPLDFSEEPSVNFFGGIQRENGGYDPVALFDNSKQLNESVVVKRYVVYANRYVYYLADTEKATFWLRIHTDEQKHMHFSFGAHNKGSEKLNVYLFSMFRAILRYRESETFWDRMTKFGKFYGNSYLLRSNENCLVINFKNVSTCTDGTMQHTVGQSDVLFNRKSVLNSPVLLTGTFPRERYAINTTDIPLAAEMLQVALPADEEIRCEFDLSYYHDLASAEQHVTDSVDIAKIDAELEHLVNQERTQFDSLKIRFEDWNGQLDAQLVNQFIRSVQKQVSFCALGKNYAGSLIGVRDVMQQLDGSLMWQPERSREKILNTLNYILEDGRAPRQYSVPDDPEVMPEMDLREFIDQGVWVISTVYAYLAFTDDYSILSEPCTYYVVDADNTCVIRKSEIVDTALDHLLKIMQFLTDHLDTDTDCLRILFGDWNDAIDGLGKTKDTDKKFGSGVSVMATLQFYRNCEEMIEILSALNKHTEKIEEYKAIRAKIEVGLAKHAIDTDQEGNRRIVHGWGDKLSYKIGSFNDPDGVARLSSTAHSFWALSGMIRTDESLKGTIKNTFDSLKSKYGLLTFDKPFTMASAEEVGRLSTVTIGTYENAASYVHAALFAGSALFAIGESKTAWEELEKSAVISHDNCTMTPFIMPNSYCYNPDYYMDGESMGDWYTGSGTVLLKEIVRYGFGIMPNLSGLWVALPNYMHTTSAELRINIKGNDVTVIYKKAELPHREYWVDGTRYAAEYDGIADTDKIFIPNAQLHNGLVIEARG